MLSELSLKEKESSTGGQKPLGMRVITIIDYETRQNWPHSKIVNPIWLDE